ncbi:precorrin-6A/cobalt-precorrin-6A reductase [Halovulum sp. GXIMD14793]
MKILVLAGTGEARKLCALLADLPEVEVLASLAGATARPEDYAVPVRIGGFGGAEGLAWFLADHDFDMLIDATHPFAVNISQNAIAAVHRHPVYFTILRRPAWPADPAWQQFENPSSAIAALPDNATAFLAFGAQSAGLLSSFPDKHLYLRVVDPPAKPFPNLEGGFVLGKAMSGPAAEEDLFTQLGITHLVCRNSGGQGGRAKLTAAQRLGTTVHMVVRPPEPVLRLDRTIDLHDQPQGVLEGVRRILANHIA